MIFIFELNRTPMNPGRFSRGYGMEYLKHYAHGNVKNYRLANSGWPKYVLLFLIFIYI